jgi:cyclopropane-fatty-acyl-phospholipid synthase
VSGGHPGTAIGSGGASAAAIRHHYDVGNEFFAAWLDATRTYSGALFAPGDDLEAAQHRKLDHHLTESRARDVGALLDVGCGWGSLLRRATERYGVARAVGLTLSAAQAEWIRAQGAPGVEVRIESWEEHEPSASYDAAVSIGAFEHFCSPDLDRPAKVARYGAFFERCREWLRPGAFLSLQTIAWGNAGREVGSRFIAESIFPQSNLPELSEIADASKGRFELVRLRNDRADYERTCREWLRRLKHRRAEASAHAGEAVTALYERYLGLSVIGFHVGQSDLLRLTFRRVDAQRGRAGNASRA